nr:fimbrillin family protein [Parabacteroides goldsteinii]
MKGIQWIGGGIMLLCIGACTHDKWADFSDGAVELGFTASTEKLEVNRTLGGTTALTDGANVAVHVWKGATPSEAQKAAYSNTYTVQIKASVADELVPTGGAMKVESADGYRFYALSTNSAQVAVPGLSSDCRTVSLRNGVDYLMAVNDNDGSGFSISTTSDPIPLTFRHLATQIVLRVNPAGTNGYTNALGLVVSIAAVDSTDSYIDLSASWPSNSSTPSTMIYWPARATTDGSDPVPATGGVPLEQPDGQRKEAVKGDNNLTFTVSFILLPVSTTARGIPLQMDFTGLSFDNGINTLPLKSYTARMMATGDASELVLKGGYTYTFDATITRNSASFSLPKIDPWVVDGVNLDEIVEVDPT